MGADRAGQAFWTIIRELGVRVLPNTAGCKSVKEAVTTAHMAREIAANAGRGRHVDNKTFSLRQIGVARLHEEIVTEEPGADNAASKRHLALEVESITDARATMLGAGVAIDEGRPLEGVTRFFVRDPAGNRLELFQRISSGTG